MSSGMKKLKCMLLLVSVVCIAALIVCGLLFTSGGSRMVVDTMLSGYSQDGEVEYNNVDGSLVSGMVFENVEIRDIRKFPEGTVLNIQRLFFNLDSLSLDGIQVEIDNARLKLPDSETIVISGTFKAQQLDFNIFSNGFTVNEVLGYLPDFKSLVPIQGDISDADLYVSGHFLEPAVKGSLTIERFVYKGFMLSKAPVSFDIQLKEIYSNIQLHGTVSLQKGDLETKRVLVKLQPGQLNFSGPWDQPRLNLKGSSKVERTKIQISLKGTVEKPELSLSSEPPYPREKLMIMLATGKSWKSVDDSIQTGLNSAALTKDFIDYFLFARKSNSFASRFGISEFSVTFNENSKGIAAKKELSDSMEVGYGIEQSKKEGQLTDVTQKLQGEVQVNKNISVGVEREVKQETNADLLNEPAVENNDKVMIKYKKRF